MISFQFSRNLKYVRGLMIQNDVSPVTCKYSNKKFNLNANSVSTCCKMYLEESYWVWWAGEQNFCVKRLFSKGQ
jgi:hypothetical protein